MMTMFYGHHTIQFGNKKSISLPERFAKDIHSDVFITQGFDGNLIIMPEQTFLEFYQRTSTINIANPLARLFRRHLLAHATIIGLSEINHIEISGFLCEYADLPKETTAVLVGQGNHIEIWGQKKWQEQSKALQDVNQNISRFAGLDIRTNQGISA